jgi:putative transposase
LSTEYRYEPRDRRTVENLTRRRVARIFVTPAKHAFDLIGGRESILSGSADCLRSTVEKRQEGGTSPLTYFWALASRLHLLYGRFAVAGILAHRDNDHVYCKTFDAFLKKAFKGFHPNKRVRIITTAFNCPDMNPYIESFIGTIKRECLNYFVFLGLSHMNRVIKMFLDHYHTARPHQGKNNECLDINVSRPKHGEIKRRAVVGGLINEYYREAA